MASTNTAAIRVGRLLEIRVDAGYRELSEVDALFAAIGAEVAKLPRDRQIVTVVDWRRCPVMEPAASERVRQRMMANNPRIERSAALAAADAPVAVLQFMRLVRESQLPHRKMFLSATDLISWMDEVLDAAERARLRQFLG